MKPLFTAAMALLLSACAFAQNFSSQQGPDFASTEGYSFENMASSGDNTIILLSRGTAYTMQVFGKDMKLQNTYAYNTGHMCRHKVVTADGIYFFMFYYDENTKSYKADVAGASTADFKFTVKTIFTLKADEVDTNRLVVDYGNILTDDNIYNFIVSNDNTAFAFYIDFAGKKGKGNEKRLAVYNLAGQALLFEKQFTDAESHEFIGWQEDFELNNNRTAAYFTGFAKVRAKTGRRGELWYQLEKLDATGYKSVAFKSEAHSATNSTKLFQKGNKLYCVGLYTLNPNNDRGAEGVCFYEIDPAALSITNSTFTPFTPGFNMDKFSKEKGKKLYGHFILKTGGFANDGSLLYVVQDYQMAVSSGVAFSGGNRIATSNTKQDFGDIIAAKVTTDGTVAYLRNLNPNVPQISSVLPYSCSSTVLNGEVCFFFNSEKDAQGVNNEVKPKGDTTYLELYTLTDKGAITVKDIVPGQAGKVFYHPKFATGAIGQFVFYGVQDKQRNLLKAVLK